MGNFYFKGRRPSQDIENSQENIEDNPEGACKGQDAQRFRHQSNCLRTTCAAWTDTITLWKDYPNNSNFKKYNWNHYSKVREQEKTVTLGANKDARSRSNEKQSESKRRRRHCKHKKHGKVHSTDSYSIHGNDVVFFSQVRNLLGSFDDCALHSESSVSIGKVVYVSTYEHMIDESTRSNIHSIPTMI